MSRSRSPPRPAPPGEREALLEAAAGPARPIYAAVRGILDDLEAAAPWALLYYPPEELESFLGLARNLAGTIAGIPARIQALTQALATDGTHPPTDETLADIQFFFEGIHMMARPELDKLLAWLGQVKESSDGSEMPAAERTYLCEVASDLKGKYTSSIMGAAASLIAADRWNGVEIEPILFPEKADEFERNRLLLRTLDELSESIRKLPKEVSLPHLVATWRQGKKVDQYALTPFYGFLAALGQLLKEGTRRALYSGDYHQVRKREAALSARINELTMLQNASWGASFPGAPREPAALFAEMVRRATEIAALLDVDVLRQIVGERTVKDLHAVVQIEGERQKSGRARASEPSGLRAKIPEQLLSLIDILYDEDLRTFLDLLLGSVRKRASLALDEPGRAAAETEETGVEPAVAAKRAAKTDKAKKPKAQEEPEPAAGETPLSTAAPRSTAAPPSTAASPSTADSGASEALPSIEALLAGESPAFYLDPDLAWEPDVAHEEESATADEPAPATTPAATPAAAATGAPVATRPVAVQDRLSALEEVQVAIEPLLAATHPERKAFDFLHRFLKQKRSVPPGMVKSIHPFLRLLLDDVAPKIAAAVAHGDLPAGAQENLERSCHALLDGRIGPDELKAEVPVHMDRLLHLLEGLSSATAAMQEELAPGSGYWKVARSDDLSREW